MVQPTKHNARRPLRRRGRGLESLEDRRVLAGDVTLVADQFQLQQNGDVSQLDVLANDQFSSDYAGPRQITAVSYGSEGGRIVIRPDGRALDYHAPADFAGDEKFSYFVDGQFTETVTVKLVSPLRGDSFRLVPDGEVHPLNVLANDPFWANYPGPRRITGVSVTSGLSDVAVSADGGRVDFRVDGAAHGQELFTYIVDGKYSASVTVDVAEVLRSDTFEVLQNAASQTLPVLANDPFWPDYQGDRRVTVVSDSLSNSGAQIDVASGGRGVQYQPAPDYVGYDQFDYGVDGQFETSVSVMVLRPVQDDWFEIDQNSGSFPLDVLQNDRYWSPLQQRHLDVVNRVTSVSASEQGGTVAVSGNGTAVLYSPPVGFAGEDTFTYVADGKYPARVSVRVTRPVRDDYVSVYQDTPQQLLAVSTNDFLGNGAPGPRQITGVTTSEQGVTATIVGSMLRYTPPAGFVGMDRLTYTVDHDLTASVSVQVQPLAQGDYFYFCSTLDPGHSLNVLSNDYFALGYPGPGIITAATMTQGNGQVSIAADGRSLIFASRTSLWDQISYTVDGKYEAIATVSRSNHLAYDQLVTDQNSSPRTFSVLANDFNFNDWNCPSSSYQGQRRITEVRPGEQGGQVTVSADGRTVQYTPAPDFYGQDTFTYVVDGVMEATASVNVVRRVIDDEYRVVPGEAKSLTVLLNDLFGSDYRGAHQITGVTESLVGATVRIAPDGRSLIYQAPADFHGMDSLTYTVDGQLKATVQVSPAVDPPFAQFGSLADFEEFLIADALERYADQFGQPYYAYPWWLYDGDLQAAPNEMGGVGRDHSQTNVQVTGVDEGDIVEFDADYVYMLTGNDLVILSAWPAESLAELSRFTLDGTVESMYLSGDRLTVISQLAVWPEPVQGGPIDVVVGDVTLADATLADMARPGMPDAFWYPRPLRYETIVTVLDVANRAAPAVVQQTRMEGAYVQSRAIGDYVYVAVTNQAMPAGPQVVYDPPASEGELPTRGTYETQEAYLTRVRANLGQFVADSLPNYSSLGSDGTVVRSGLLHEPEDLYRPLVDGAASLVSLVSINVQQNEPGLAASVGVYTNGATEVYASLEHFYLFENGYEPEVGAVTRILQFDWDATDGSTHFAARGEVPGSMLNQFSADEYEGHLRIVTTISHGGSGNWTNQAENDLFVLREDHGLLDFVGSMQNVALGETARSVRFMGPRAFLVTFRTVDPLFALDVSDPTQPHVAGYLTLPGFSSYAQMIDETHLLTVGRNTPNGISGPAQVSLFDVSDLAHPRLVDEHTFARYSESEAAADHHAFGYFARHGLLAIPTQRSYVARYDRDGDGYSETREWTTEHELAVLRVDVSAPIGSNQGLQLVAEIEHDSAVRRSGYIDDKLYSIASNSVHVVDVADPQTIIASATDLQPDLPIDTPVFPPFWELTAARFASVQQHLANRLLIDSGRVMPIVTEQVGAAWQAVVRVDETYYRYALDGELVTLVDDQFQFATSDGSASWQNPDNELDVNGDGHVAPSDALLIIDRLTAAGSGLDGHVVRQIEASGGQADPYWDVSGDGRLSPLDVLLVINEVNRLSHVNIDTGTVRADDPVSLSDVAAVDELFASVRRTAGDANLDGIFSSADLVLIFQRGKYEDGITQSATWEDGDWNGDRTVNSADLVLAFSHGSYEFAAQIAEAVAIAKPTDND